jgi:DNA-binding response OmpR family regulator
MRGDGETAAAATVADTVVVVEAEVLVRLVIAAYLRDCGYRVVEATSAAEAIQILDLDDLRADVVLTAVDLGGEADGFALAQWVRRRRPGLEVLLAGTVAREADLAGDLCHQGPTLSRPYEPQAVVDRIRRLLARRRRDEAPPQS